MHPTTRERRECFVHIALTGPRVTQAAMLTLSPTNLSGGEWRSIHLHADCAKRTATAQLGDRPAATIPFITPAAVITRITFRTGDRIENLSPDRDRPTDPSRYQVKAVVVRPK